MIHEIVCAKIGKTITNNRELITRALEEKTITQFLDRKHMQLMSSFDLGHNWDVMASGPTLFCMDDDGNVFLPEKEIK